MSMRSVNHGADAVGVWLENNPYAVSLPTRLTVQGWALYYGYREYTEEFNSFLRSVLHEFEARATASSFVGAKWMQGVGVWGARLPDGPQETMP
jgi:hypothetical protein